MKINNKVMNLFLDKIDIETGKTGTVPLENFLISFEDGMESFVANKGTQVAALVKVSKEGFTKFEKHEAIGIKNLKTLQNFVGRFSDEIDFTIKNNVLEMKSASKKIVMSLIEKDYASPPGIVLSEIIYHVPEFQLETKFLKDILDDTEIYSNVSVVFECKDGKLSVTVQETNSPDHIVTRTDIPFLKGHNFKTEFQKENLKPILKRLTEPSVRVKLQTDYPLIIREIGKQFTTLYLVAPIVHEETKEEPKEEVE
jgi:hypothetical protein